MSSEKCQWWRILSKEFENFLGQKGIRHEMTVARTPEQNGVAERMDRTLTEVARSNMLSHAGMPNMFQAKERYWRLMSEIGYDLRRRSRIRRHPMKCGIGRKPN